MKRISKNTVIRTAKTFIQAFLGAFISAGMLVGWTDTDIKNSLSGCLLTGLFAGLSAIAMNLENKEVNDDE